MRWRGERGQNRRVSSLLTTDIPDRYLIVISTRSRSWLKALGGVEIDVLRACITSYSRHGSLTSISTRGPNCFKGREPGRLPLRYRNDEAKATWAAWNASRWCCRRGLQENWFKPPTMPGCRRAGHRPTRTIHGPTCRRWSLARLALVMGQTALSSQTPETAGCSGTGDTELLDGPGVFKHPADAGARGQAADSLSTSREVQPPASPQHRIGMSRSRTGFAIAPSHRRGDGCNFPQPLAGTQEGWERPVLRAACAPAAKG